MHFRIIRRENEWKNGGRKTCANDRNKEKKEGKKVTVDGKIDNDNIDERRTERGR